DCGSGTEWTHHAGAGQRPLSTQRRGAGVGGSVRHHAVVPAVVLSQPEPHRTTLEVHEASRPIRSLPPDFPGLSSRHPRGSRRFVNQVLPATGLVDDADFPAIRRRLTHGRVRYIHRETAQHGPADLAGIDGLLHPPYRLIPSPLADDPKLDPVLLRRGYHRVAILEARRERLLDQDVGPCPGRLDRRPGVNGVRSADEDRRDFALLDHGRNVSVRTTAIPRGESLGSRWITVTDRDEIRLGQSTECLGLDLAGLAATNQGRSNAIHRLTPENGLRSSAGGTPATRPSLPCRSSRPRCSPSPGNGARPGWRRSHRSHSIPGLSLRGEGWENNRAFRRSGEVPRALLPQPGTGRWRAY